LTLKTNSSTARGQKRWTGALAAIRKDGENRGVKEHQSSHVFWGGKIAVTHAALHADIPVPRYATESENKILQNSYMVCRNYHKLLRPIYVN